MWNIIFFGILSLDTKVFLKNTQNLIQVENSDLQQNNFFVKGFVQHFLIREKQEQCNTACSS
jgi:hypothetical protein